MPCFPAADELGDAVGSDAGVALPVDGGTGALDRAAAQLGPPDSPVTQIDLVDALERQAVPLDESLGAVQIGVALVRSSHLGQFVGRR
jgi:hypothetical protein